MDDWDALDDWSDVDDMDGWDADEEEEEDSWTDWADHEDDDADEGGEDDEGEDGGGEDSWSHWAAEEGGEDGDHGACGAGFAQQHSGHGPGDMGTGELPGVDIRRAEAGPGEVVSAWEFGTAAAVAGWLLDGQAERIAEAVRSSVRAAPGASPGPAPPSTGGSAIAARNSRSGAGRPPWKGLTGAPVDWHASPLRQGEVLERSRLAVTLALHLGTGRQLGLDARPLLTAGSPTGSPGVDWSQISFSIAVVDLVPELPLWVMVDLRPRGFTAERVQPFFTDPGPPGRAYCFVDAPEAALKVIDWALARCGVALHHFRWQPPG